MDYSLDGSGDQLMKLWRFEVVEGHQPQQIRENVYMAPTLRRGTKDYLTMG